MINEFSESQKRRIAIARAIVKNSPILIIDGAVTNGLYGEDKRVVEESLNEIMQGKMSIILSNKLSIIRDADEILVFKNGQFVERGSYEMLRAQQGFFSEVENVLALDLD